MTKKNPIFFSKVLKHLSSTIDPADFSEENIIKMHQNNKFIFDLENCDDYSNGRSYFFILAENNRLKLMKYLLEQKLFTKDMIYEANDYGVNAFLVSASLEMKKLLWAQGFDTEFYHHQQQPVNSNTNEYSYNALTYLLRDDCVVSDTERFHQFNEKTLNNVKFLVETVGINPNLNLQPNNSFSQYLSMAIKNGHSSTIDYLAGKCEKPTTEVLQEIIRSFDELIPFVNYLNVLTKHHLLDGVNLLPTIENTDLAIQIELMIKHPHFFNPEDSLKAESIMSLNSIEQIVVWQIQNNLFTKDPTEKNRQFEKISDYLKPMIEQLYFEKMANSSSANKIKAL